jgi:hypothetical protein
VAVAGYLSRFWEFPYGAPLTPVHLCGIPHKPLDLLTLWLAGGRDVRFLINLR